ncbi:hypothetical protein [Saccharopolyspora shandongensis]|uniref:hypothetical protein n=1 Tax=Saccharopolyspora shandongensis TaxID=418495 RepID=UPI0033DCB6FC
MTSPSQLTPAEQNELLGDLTKVLISALPSGWQQLIVDYRQIGRHIDIGVGVRKSPDGELELWDPPQETWTYVQRLRHGMYAEGKGTWFSARFTIEPPDTYRVQYNYWDLPAWGQAPVEEFRVDLRRYPRTEDNMPVWFQMQLG